MRILVVGAGAVGGYFGGRLLEAGRDVTFLVRPKRAAELKDRGLVIRSPFGDATLPNPPTVLAATLHDPFDLILLSSKAYHLDDAIADFAPAVGSATAILPMLNGLRHLDLLDSRFGAAPVLGGQCRIAATLGQERVILHLNDIHAVSFGERDGTLSERVQSIAAAIEGARFDSQASTAILLDMWEKWVFLASLAGSTCLMRAAVGDIVASPGGSDLALGMLAECAAIAAAEGYPIRETSLSFARSLLTTAGSSFTASMLRDMERNSPIEADHIVGDLLDRARRHPVLAVPYLAIAYTHLKAYEHRRSR